MKFIFTADWHFSAYIADKIIKESGLPERLDSLIKTINNMINYGRKNNINNIVVGGDILHNKNIIYSSSLSLLIDLIRINKDINFIFLDGNHDMSSKSIDSISGLKSLDSEENVHSIHEIEKIENILFVPWKYASKEILKKEKSDYLISHLGLNEGVLNSGISIISNVSIKDLSNFKFVLLGHYHRNQKLTNNNTTLYYVGSPLHLDWGEKNEEKRFLVVDTELDIIQSIPTVGYKKYLEYEITEENKQQVIERARKEQECGSYVKIVKKDKIDLGDNIDDLQIIDKTEVDITNRGISSSMSKADIFKRYAEAKEIPENEIENYLKVATQLIEGV